MTYSFVNREQMYHLLLLQKMERELGRNNCYMRMFIYKCTEVLLLHYTFTRTKAFKVFVISLSVLQSCFQLNHWVKYFSSTLFYSTCTYIPGTYIVNILYTGK